MFCWTLFRLTLWDAAKLLQGFTQALQINRFHSISMNSSKNVHKLVTNVYKLNFALEISSKLFRLKRKASFEFGSPSWKSRLDAVQLHHGLHSLQKRFHSKLLSFQQWTNSQYTRNYVVKSNFSYSPPPVSQSTMRQKAIFKFSFL